MSDQGIPAIGLVPGERIICGESPCQFPWFDVIVYSPDDMRENAGSLQIAMADTAPEDVRLFSDTKCNIIINTSGEQRCSIIDNY